MSFSDNATYIICVLMFEPQASGLGGESFFGMRNVFSWMGFKMLSYLLRMSIFSLATFFTYAVYGR